MKNSPLLLRAKHWHIFVALIVLAIFSMMIMGIVMATAIVSIQDQILGNSRASIHPETFSWILYVFPFVVLLAASPQLLWMWSIVNRLGRFVPPTDKMPRVRLFNITFVVFLIVISYLPVYIFNFAFKVAEFQDALSPGTVVGFILGVFAIQMVLMFCVLNNTYVVAKTIKMAETKSRVKFSDFMGDFFFILFLFPIAIWFIQPRVNKILEDELNGVGLLKSEDTLDM